MSSEDYTVSDGDIKDLKQKDLKENISTGDYIIVEYKEQQFPGEVTNVKSEGVVVSTLTKYNRNG